MGETKVSLPCRLHQVCLPLNNDWIEEHFLLRQSCSVSLGAWELAIRQAGLALAAILLPDVSWELELIVRVGPNP